MKSYVEQIKRNYFANSSTIDTKWPFHRALQKAMTQLKEFFFRQINARELLSVINFIFIENYIKI